ncbi:FAD-dependent urate hydroxylase-like protein [Cladobotryum mycophilum]|uniref:FAD-dependent urate hydroxylase-like protein n=1 Tax=Cladobotryum mycophilum TaxID=491253 RepID=A0ABR0T2K5_9HYPO
MGRPFHIIVVGAGPAGLSTALSLAQISDAESPIQVTVLEVRDRIQTLGGAVNLTPLALRYLDSLGVGEGLRLLGSGVEAIELVSHRTGGLLGRLWPGVDAIRVQRQLLVESMMETIRTLLEEQVKIIFGAKIQTIEESGSPDSQPGFIKVTYKTPPTTSDTNHVLLLEADMLIGCDGLHSQVRTQYVEPARQKTYSGKCNAYGYSSALTPSESARWLRTDDQPLITDTVLVSKGNDSLLMSYYTQSQDSLYMAAVMPLEDKSGADGSREGWAVHEADKAGLKRDIEATYAGGRLDCLPEIVNKCDEWFFFPVYMLPPEESGPKAEPCSSAMRPTMPPQGESTGVAIEDGVLLAHVLTRRTSRTVLQLFSDYEKLRRADIDATYKETMARWNMPVPPGWMSGFVMEWLTWGYVKFMNLRADHFGRDVRKLALPE